MHTFKSQLIKVMRSPIPILMYHRVLPFEGNWAVTVAQFESQMAYLKRHGYRALSGPELLAGLRGESVPERAIAITFDDGYRDNWHLAAPILEKYGMRALLFVVTSKVKNAPEPLSGDWREEGDDCFLSWEEIHSMSDSGLFEIHTHTHSHRRFWLDAQSASETRRMVYQDVATSIDVLRGQGFVHPLQLAWPWGYFKDDWLDDIAALGVTGIHTTQLGTNFPGQGSQTIRRVGGEKLNSSISLKLSLLSTPVVGKFFNSGLSLWTERPRRTKAIGSNSIWI